RVEHGPLIAMMVGISFEKIGLDALEGVALQLKALQRKELAAKLESFDRERLPFMEVDRRERYFARQVADNPIKLLVGRIQMRPLMKRWAEKHESLSSRFKKVTEELRR